MSPVGGVVRGLSIRSLRVGQNSDIERPGRGVGTMRETDILGGTDDIRVLPFGRELLSGDDNPHQRSGDRRRIPISRRFGSGRMRARVHTVRDDL
jgi:hypothetical protein